MSRRAAGTLGLLLLAGSLLAAQSRPEAARRALEGLEAIEVGRFDVAEAAFTEARRLDPANVSYSLGLAQVHLSTGRPAKAIPLLEECLRKLPGDFDVRFTLAQAYLGAERDADATRVLQGKIPGDPLRAPWLFHQGFALFRLNDYAAALPIFEKLLSFPDMRAPGEFFVANCRAAMGQLTESLPHYERAIELGTRADNRALNAYYYNFGLALFRLDRYEDAAMQFAASARLYSADPMPHYLLGRSMAKLERFPEAIEAMEGALRLNPEFSAGCYQLAQLHQRHGDQARAKELFQRVAQLKEQELQGSMEALLHMKTGRE